MFENLIWGIILINIGRKAESPEATEQQMFDIWILKMAKIAIFQKG